MQLKLWDSLPQEQTSNSNAEPLLFPNARKAQKLRLLADGMTENITAKMTPPIASLNITHHRSRIIKSLYEEGLKLEKIQSWLYALADRTEQGNLPSILKEINTKSQVEVLVIISGDSWNIQDIENVFASKVCYEQWIKRLKYADIETPAQCIKAIAALKELTSDNSSTALVQSEALEISRLKREAVLQDIPDFFPTPKALLEQIMYFAELRPGMKVLEPSAGYGTICLEIRTAGIQPDCFEISPTLREILFRQGLELIGNDFMLATPKPIYDRVLANPPFSKGIDILHVQRAFEWLIPAGRLVSIASSSYIHNSSHKYKHFRSWLKQVGAKELDNPSGSFLHSECRTNVNTRTIVIDKPLENVSAEVLA